MEGGSCDILVLVESGTLGRVVLCKNSDRPPCESQPLVFHPRARHPPGSKLKLEYIEIPEVEITYATLGSAPYWCWGYEMGVNEHQVAIGNVAVFTKPLEEAIRERGAGRMSCGLLGMDLVRLGLERGRDAEEALFVITELLERYGQFGSGIPGEDHERGSYDNSFIIADEKRAFVLETAGREWAAKRIERGFYAISNKLSIRTEFDLKSRDLVRRALERGWWRGEGDFDFAFAYTDFRKPLWSSHLRARRAWDLLRAEENPSPEYLMRVMRDHYESSFITGSFNPALSELPTLCMHSSPAGITWGDTAASAIIILGIPELDSPLMLWCAGTPCTGCYLPFFIKAGSPPDMIQRAGRAGKITKAPPQAPPDEYSPDSYWWLFKELLWIVKGDELGTRYPKRQPLVRAAFDELERSFLSEIRKIGRRFKAEHPEEEERRRMLRDLQEECLRRTLEALFKLKEILPEL